jgi:hypothetical protein
MALKYQISNWQIGLSAAFTLVSYPAYSTLNMVAICSFERSVEFQRSARCYSTKDNILQVIFVYRGLSEALGP